MARKLYYVDPYLKTAKAKISDLTIKGDKIEVSLTETIFYPRGGGQPGDKGKIRGDGFEIIVEDTVERDGEIWHVGKLNGRTPEVGEEVELELDWEWRYGNMQMHTGQHILSAVLKKRYDLDTSGFNIFGDYAKIEVNGELNWEMIEEAELEANKVIIDDLPVRVEEYEVLPKGVVEKLRKYIPNIKGKIRIVRIGENFDLTPCGGTHVKSTREVGVIKVLRFYKKSKDTWRIEFTCGFRAIKKLNEILKDYWSALDAMPNKNPPLSERVREVLESVESLEEKVDSMRKEVWKWKEESLLGRSIEIGHYNVVTFVEKWDIKDAQAFAVDFVKNNPGTIVVLASEDYVILARNEEVEVSMKSLLEDLIKEFGGKGGGTDNLARGKIEAEPEDVIDFVVDRLREIIGA
ncbi:alanyl-tRNA editing protein [Pyrococcus abyssi]|uniref:Alanyl-tRNA synthetase related protein n=1 Tax=Pyrococcus abyssi (strain GE5 / Orsay) TaxID=272844 RepID=Q9UXV2_PYRAB